MSEKHLLRTFQLFTVGEITFKESSEFQAEGKAGSAKVSHGHLKKEIGMKIVWNLAYYLYK